MIEPQALRPPERETALVIVDVQQKLAPAMDAAAPRGVPLHPAQLYEAGLDLVLAVVLQRRLKTPAPAGSLVAFYLMGTSGIRFVVQFFRDDDRGHLLFGLAHSQFLSMALLTAGAVLWLSPVRRSLT